MRSAAIVLGLTALFVLSGCSTGEFASIGKQSTSTTPGSQTVQGSLRGRVHGGQFPVSGAVIQLYDEGVATIGSTAQSTPGVAMTDANGNFNITNQYTCLNSTDLVYITSTGGNPGLTAGTNNSAIVLISALGQCGTVEALSTPIVINEVTTVASVYALAQFIPNGSGAGITGGSQFNPQAGIGYANAFNEVPNMIDIFTGTAYTQTVNGTGYVPQTEIYTLADILVPCVNSASTLSTPSAACTALFTAATPTSGTPPTTVLGAALDIALNPGHNVGTLFNLSTANAAFQPTLSGAPNDWTVAVAYDVSSANHPQGLAIDSNGNAWITAWVSENPANAEILMISPIGVPASNDPYTSTTNLNGSAGIAVDLNGVVWVANSGNGSAMSVLPVSNAITPRFGPFFPPSMPSPLQVATDVSDNLWFTASGNNTVVEFVPNPNYETAITYNVSSGAGLNDPTGIAIYYTPPNFNTFPPGPAVTDVWVANQGADSVDLLNGSSNNYSGGGITNPAGAAVDGSGDIWVTNPSTNSVSELNSSGGVVSSSPWTGGGLDGPSGIAIDGNGNFWVANTTLIAGTTNSSITELSGVGAALTPATGYQSITLQGPTQIAVDASGNVWAINTNEVTSVHGHETVTEFLGLAAPVNVPLVQAMNLQQIGQRPH